MSLIFNALKRNRTGGNVDKSFGPEAPVVRQGQTIRNLMSSPTVILISAATLFASGLLAAHAVHSFSGAPDQVMPPEKPKTFQFIAFVPESGPNPTSLTNARPHTASDTSPITAIGGSDHHASGITFSTPVDNSRDTLQTVNANSPPPVAISESTFPTAVQVDDQVTALAQQSAGEMESGDSSDSLASSIPHVAALTGPSVSHGFSSVKQSDVTTVAPPRVTSPATLPEPSAIEIQRQRRSKAHLKTQKLTGKILGAIHAEDFSLSDRLLSDLEELNGYNHLYVRKLRAYWLIRQERLVEARELLALVLATHPDDHEAGLNMAVVDMLEGKRDAARERLLDLQDRFPEKRAIAAYLLQLDR